MTLNDYIRVFKRRKTTIIIVTLFATLFALWWSKAQKELYSAESTVEIRKNLITEGVGIRKAFISSFEKQTILKLAQNREVAELAVVKLREMYPASFSSISDTARLASVLRAGSGVIAVNLDDQANLLRVTAVDASPARATEYANGYAEAVILYHDRDRRQTVASLLEYLSEQMRIYEGKMLDLDAQREELSRSSRGPGGRPASADVLAGITTQIGELEVLLGQATGKLAGLSTSLAGRDVSRLAELITAPEVGNDKAAFASKRAELQAASAKFTDAHPSVTRLKEETAELEAALLEKLLSLADLEIEKTTRAIRDLESRLEQTRIEEGMIRRAIENLPEAERRGSQLEREAGIVNSVYQMFRQKKEDIDITLSSTPADQLKIGEYATLPRQPLSPKGNLVVGMGLCIGILVSFACAFLLESLDTSLIAMRDVERFIEKPILAVIPAIHIDPEKVKASNHPMRKELLHKLPLLIDARSPAAEAFRTLRAVLQNRFFKTGKKKLLITSSTPQEGKTTTTINLAMACADAGIKTVLIGANMRHPVIGRHFRIDRSRGLNDMLMGKITFAEGLQETGHENLSIIDSGSFARRPAELLAKNEFDGLLDWLTPQFDAILIDSPPTLPVADAATMAPKVDGILIVYLASVAPRDALLRCKETLEEIGGNVIGIVFNDVRGASQDDYAGYYYHHKYAGDEFRRI